MTTEKSQVERWLDAAKNHKILSVTIFAATVLGGIASVSDSFRKIFMPTTGMSASQPNVNATDGSMAAGRDITNSSINIGFTPEQYEKSLMLRQASLRKSLEEVYESQLTRADNNTKREIETRTRLETELSGVQQKLGQLSASYQETISKLTDANRTIDHLEGQVPQARLKAARLALKSGSEAAYEAFGRLVDEGGKPIASAAFEAGQLAEDAVRYEDALRRYRQAATLDESNAEYLASAGVMAQVMGRYDEAEPWLVQALSINRKQLGDEHPYTATAMNNLGALYESQGRYGEAEPLLVQALAIRNKQLGKEHPRSASAMNNLAGLYRSQGRYDEAEPLLAQALSISKEKLGIEHPLTARSMNNLASLFRAQGRYGEAESLLIEALTISKEQFGDEHPDTATPMGNLAGVYRSQGRLDEAEPLYVKALAITKKHLGDKHSLTATSIDNLAGLYQAQGRLNEAEPLFTQALAVRRKQLGNEHPETAISINNLAYLYQSQGRFDAAEPLFVQALTTLSSHLGEDHPNTLAVKRNLQRMRNASKR